MATSGGSAPASPLREALSIQGRVVWALILREMLTRYGRNNIGVLWLFLEPMLFIGAITGIWAATRSFHNSDIPIAAFALTGYSSMMLWRTLPARCIGAAENNRTLLHHRYVKVLDIYIARILLEQGAVTVSFLVLGFALYLGGLLMPPEDVLEVWAGWLLLAWFGAGLALTIGALAERWDVIAKIWSPIALLLFPFSGAAYMVDALPPHARELNLYLPMIHGLEFMREGFFGTKIVAHYDLFYLVVWNVALTVFGLSQVRRIAAGDHLL
ncbi:ABC transporter permease [Altererythrobacter sp. B11]|uniref:ABC transporter permease n=1 Tax=Altererythrobacter sp. B11 TaxID=2060312 RepID=UPI000E5B2636|nr:ABC transporter permease [Altererythrobacter sp. B11]